MNRVRAHRVDNAKRKSRAIGAPPPGRWLVTSVLAASVIQVCGGKLFADSSVSYTGGNYTQDFNSLWTNFTTPPANLEPGLAPIQIGPQTVGSSPIDLTGPSSDAFTTIPAVSSMTGWHQVRQCGPREQLLQPHLQWRHLRKLRHLRRERLRQGRQRRPHPPEYRPSHAG